MWWVSTGWQVDPKPRLDVGCLTPVAIRLFIKWHCPSVACEIGSLSSYCSPHPTYKSLPGFLRPILWEKSERKIPKQVLLCVPWFLRNLNRNHEELNLLCGLWPCNSGWGCWNLRPFIILQSLYKILEILAPLLGPAQLRPCPRFFDREHLWFWKILNEPPYWTYLIWKVR